MTWGLYSGETLKPPLRYSNGKTQEDIVDEIIEAFESYDIVALRGGVGTGKSAIAIHVAAEIGNGKGIIVVPTKVLEDQYVTDYGGGKFRIVLNGRQIRFTSIMGRSNFRCPFFSCLASSSILPCTKSLTVKDGSKITRLRRIDVASRCPHWSPIITGQYLPTYTAELDDIKDIIEYESVTGKKMIVVRNPCPYYRQFLSYASRNVILMNSAIWEIDTFMGRKPRTKIEIVDEADAWLDSLTFERQISTKTIQRLIDQYADEDPKIVKELDELLIELTLLLNRYDGYTGEVTDDWIGFIDKFTEIFDEIEREANISSLLNIDKVWMTIDAKWERVRFFVPNLKAVFARVRERSAEKVLLMSATFPPIDVLEDVFGIDDVCFIEGETTFPGTVYLRRTGKEDYVSYDKWQKSEFRKKYFSCLDEILQKAKRPVLIHVHSKRYLPADKADEKLNDRTVLREDFDEAWSTIARRGVDLKGDKCRAICILKHPFSDLSDGMLQAIRLKLGDDAFFRYYRDKADRELIQQVGRAVRSKDDWVEVWSPDLTVHSVLVSKWSGKLVRYGQMTI